MQVRPWSYGTQAVHMMSHAAMFYPVGSSPGKDMSV